MPRTAWSMLSLTVATLACSLVAGRPESAPTPLPAEGHLPNVDWLAYQDPTGFSIQHPLTWQQLDTGGHPVVFSLQVAPGTNLIEKRMEITVRESSGECRQSTYGAETPAASPEHILINGADFLFQAGSGIAAGNIYDWTSYSTVKDSSCITITFVLHSSSSGVYSTEPPAFDRAAESAIFLELINTFRFEQ